MIWARASVLGLAVLGVGTTSHVAADGLLPSWPVLALLLLACTALSAPLLRGPAGPLRIVTLLVGGQALTHLALSATAGHSGPTTYAGAGDTSPGTPPGAALRAELVDGRRVGSLMDQSVPPVLDTAHGAGPGPLDHLFAHGLADGPWMLLAHTAAAVALGLWLALGEAALWGLLVAVAVSCRDTLVLPLAGAAARPLIPVAGVQIRIPLLPVPPPDPLHLRVPTRRGPPVLLGT